jgi:eukaryotic-like serine/threonine-protein kinase
MTGGKNILQNRYTLLHILGQGGMGTVYLAEDNRLGNRHVAVKELSLALIPPHEQQSRLQAFQQEATILAQLRHPGIAAVSDFFFEGGNTYVVMEFVPGQTLAQLLDRQPGRRLPADQALAITRQLCQVLDYLHQQQPPLIFRDLKPENLIVQPDGQVKLIDFGIARFFKSGQQRDTVTMGTPGYASPEHYGQGQTDPRSDIYSLGIVLHEMLTGQDPSRHTPFTPLDWSNLPVAGRPAALKAVILKATQLEPHWRYSSISEMKVALSHALPSLIVTSHWPWLAAGLALMILLLMGTGFLMTQILTPTPAAPAVVAVHTVMVTSMAIAEAIDTVPPTTLIVTPIMTLTETILLITPTTLPEPTDVPTRILVRPGISLPIPGNQLVVMTGDPGDEYVPSFSPDQQRFVFMSKRSGSWQIYTAPVAGGQWQSISQNNMDNYQPRYAPDGQSLVLASRQSGAWNIYTVNVDGSDWRQLTDRSEPDYYPSYDRTGEWILYMSQRSGRWGIYLMRADGSDDHRVLSTEVQPYPMFSPDGQSIVFMDDSGGNLDIYTVTRDGQRRTRLTTHPARDATPVFSPDGNWILFETNRDGYYEIYAMRPDGSDLRNLTNYPAADQVPTLSPDGQWLIFQSRRSGNWDINRQPFQPDAPATASTSLEIEIMASHARTETGLWVQPGQRIVIDYLSGSWRAGPAPTWPFVGPEGDPQVASKSTFPVAMSPVMMLIAGVGDERPLPVGQRLEFSVPVGGLLWLGPNDDNLADNTGSLMVRITIID